MRCRLKENSSRTELLLHIKRCRPHSVAGALSLSAHYLHSRLNALCLPVNIKRKIASEMIRHPFSCYQTGTLAPRVAILYFMYLIKTRVFNHTRITIMHAQTQKLKPQLSLGCLQSVKINSLVEYMSSTHTHVLCCVVCAL